MNPSSKRNGSRLNSAIERMGPYTLRANDVVPALGRAAGLGRERIIDARLGDPIAFGLHPYPPLVDKVVSVMREERSWRYNFESRGVRELRELLGRGNPEFGSGGYTIPAERVVLGPGISGVSRALMQSIIDPEAGDQVVIPHWSYIIYFAEAALARAQVVDTPLCKDGQVDLEALEGDIGPRTKAVFITTVGNPLGVAMAPHTLRKVIRMVGRAEERYGNMICLITDSIYEGFREEGPMDPIAIAEQEAREGPLIDLYSISKLLCAPGLRLGWLRLHHHGERFKDEVEALTQSLAGIVQPSLCSNSTGMQLALLSLYSDLAGGRREGFDSFVADRAQTIRRRVHGLARALSRIEGIVFPECYYEGGALSLRALNSFYVLFGLEKGALPRGENSQARSLADHTIDNGPGPVILTTPGDSFLSMGLRGGEQEFSRAVALFEDHQEAARMIERWAADAREGRLKAPGQAK